MQRREIETEIRHTLVGTANQILRLSNALNRVIGPS